jgi:nucleotide-binding universal stress UspA family protein
VAEVWLPPPDSTESAKDSAKRVDSIIAPMYAKARRAVEEAEKLAERGRSRVSALFPKWTVTSTATYGSPAWELVFTADKWQPDLVVVGSHGLSGLGRFVLGSVSQVVLNESQSSVRIARGRVEEPDTPVRIIVGLDGSTESETVVRQVARRAWPSNSEVKLVVVDDPISVNFADEDLPAMEDEEQEDHAWAEKILAENATLLRSAPGIEVTTELIEGNPKSEMITAAEDWGADCIFVGSSGSSNTSGRFILGSVSAAVASRAHCSVEVVRKKQ